MICNIRRRCGYRPQTNTRVLRRTGGDAADDGTQHGALGASLGVTTPQTRWGSQRRCNKQDLTGLVSHDSRGVIGKTAQSQWGEKSGWTLWMTAAGTRSPHYWSWVTMQSDVRAKWSRCGIRSWRLGVKRDLFLEGGLWWLKFFVLHGNEHQEVL